MEAHLKRCFVTGGVILGFMKHAPLTAHGGEEGGRVVPLQNDSS